MVKPLVPSGILGPFVFGLADASHCMAQFDCGDGAIRPRPLWLAQRPRAFPRPHAHPFLDAIEFSSAYRDRDAVSNVVSD